MIHEFFIPMKVPTITHQQKKVHVVNGKPIFYEPEELKSARAKFMAVMNLNKPLMEFTGAVRLITKWCYQTSNKKKFGTYKTTRPDTDNIIKLLKDCMTQCEFWKDDAIVASEITEKFWAEVPGIFVYIENIKE